MNVCITNSKQKELPLLLGVMVFLIFFIYNYTGALILFYLGLACMFFCVFILSFEQLFLLCMILIPNLTMIKMLGSETAWFGYFMLLVGVKYILLKKMFISPWLIAHVLCVLVTICIYLEVSLIFTIVRNIVFFVFIFSIFKTEKSFQSTEFQKDVLVYYIIGLLLNVIFGFLFWFMRGKNIFNGYFSGIRNGRNFFSSIIAHGIGLVLLFLFKSDDKLLILPLTILFILAFGGILSGSRTFILSLIFIILEFLFLIMKPKNIGKGFILLLSCIGILIVLWDIIIPVFQHVIDRFGTEEAKGGNGRFALWAEYLKLTFSSLERILFGNGLATNYQDVVWVEGYNFQVEHNVLIQSISTVGLCGTISLFMIYMAMYKVIVVKKKFKLANWMPLCAGLLFYMSISALYSDQFNTLIMVSFIAINYFGEEKNKESLQMLPLDNKLNNNESR